MTSLEKTTAIFDPRGSRQPDLEALERTCPNCDSAMEAASCKLKCPRCGYFKSCSDF